MKTFKKFLTVFIAAAITLYGLWIGIVYWSFGTIPDHLYSEPLHILAVLALVTAGLGCLLPLQKKSSRIVFGALFSTLVAGALSLLFGH
ncbi:MAG: hypothetical protein OQK12_17635 [Motiliproteus sp.]|nr:hypothetical protein [Motiliproteus sp.]MCW9054147.1 hypothetical protein [Motiliproteus sp.]